MHRSAQGVVGLAFVSLFVATVVVSLIWTPYDPQTVDVSGAWQPVSARHWLGTDSMGRDQFSRLLVGAQVTAVAIIVATGVAAVIGTAVAFAIAPAPALLQAFGQRAVDIAIAFPTLVIAILLVTGFGASTLVAGIAVGLSSAVVVTRTVLPELQRSLASDYALLARAGGAGTWWVLTRHALPNLAPTLLVRLTQIMGGAALAEAGLSYLGFGTPSPTPSWGRWLADMQTQILLRPQALIAPAVAIVMVVLGFNLLGDALRDALDPYGVARATGKEL